jgi:hypothetical protein
MASIQVITEYYVLIVELVWNWGQGLTATRRARLAIMFVELLPTVAPSFRSIQLPSVPFVASSGGDVEGHGGSCPQDRWRRAGVQRSAYSFTALGFLNCLMRSTSHVVQNVAAGV